MSSFANSTDYMNIAGKPHDKSMKPYVEIYSHRGARSYAPENSLPGYKAALEMGVNWVDMDIVMTKDKVLVAYHDLWLNPDIISKNGKFFANSRESFVGSIPAGGFDQGIQPYLINNLTLAELQTYEAGVINRNSPYAKYFPNQINVPGTHIPTLQSVFDYVNKATNNQVNFQIEVKNDPSHPSWSATPKEYADSLYSLIQKNKLIDRVEIQAFDWRILFELQKLNPRIKTAYLVGEDDIVRMHSKNPAVAGILSGGKLLKDYNNSLPQMVKALGGSCYEPEDIALTKADLDEAHRLGLKVVVWRWPEHSGSVFDVKLTKTLIDWGIDGIITDDPKQLALLLNSYQLPHKYAAK